MNAYFYTSFTPLTRSQSYRSPIWVSIHSAYRCAFVCWEYNKIFRVREIRRVLQQKQIVQDKAPCFSALSWDGELNAEPFSVSSTFSLTPVSPCCPSATSQFSQPFHRLHGSKEGPHTDLNVPPFCVACSTAATSAVT